MKNFIFILFGMILSFSLTAQNLDKIGSEDWFSMGGGIQTNMVFNQSSLPTNAREPFTQVLTGNVAFNILGVSLPFSFSLSNNGTAYSQPFNMVALHPSYKNLKTHIGITSTSFSQYTFSGLNFAGAAAEYSFDKWTFKAFGGRLKKAIEYNAEVDNINEVSYKRMGFGIQTGFTHKIINAEIILLKAYDDPKSLKLHPKNPELTPQDNFVISGKAKVNVFSGLSLDLEHATSFITQNTRFNTNDNAYKRSGYDFLIRGNETSDQNMAWNAGVNYSYKKFKIGVKYERIAPNYKTLGGLYFNNDLENITIAPNISLFNSKLNISVNTGFQRNNLADNKANVMKRWVANGSISAQLIKGMNLSFNYSNFSSFTRKNPNADPFYDVILDTMNYYQVSENMSVSWNYSYGKEIKHAFNANGSYAESQNITGRLDDAAAFGFNTNAETTTAPVETYNGIAGYNLGLSKSKWRFGVTGNINYTEAMNNLNVHYGPGVNASKSLLENKLNITTGVTYNRQETNKELSNHVMNLRMSLRYSPKLFEEKYGKLSVSLSGNYTNRFAVDPNATSTKNSTIIANLAYTF